MRLLFGGLFVLGVFLVFLQNRAGRGGNDMPQVFPSYIVSLGLRRFPLRKARGYSFYGRNFLISGFVLFPLLPAWLGGRSKENKMSEGGKRLPKKRAFLVKNAPFSYSGLTAYFTSAAKSLFIAYLANSRSRAASLARALSAAIAAFRLLITPLESFVRAATIAFR